MWQKALQTDNLYVKTEVMQALYEAQREDGDYKTAGETAMQIVTLKDSIAQQEKAEDIRGVQERFDSELQRSYEQARFNFFISAISALLLLVMALAIYLLFRYKKGYNKLQKIREQLEWYRNQLKVLEEEGKTDSKEVKRLTQKISELQAKQVGQLQNGRERYEEVMAGRNTIRWSRNDFSDCIEYYRTVDAAFITHMEIDYCHLSAKYIFFALMEHLGKSDEELQHAMAISRNTVRSYRSRINSACQK